MRTSSRQELNRKKANVVSSSNRPNGPSSSFPIRRAKGLVKDLIQPNPWIYWTDFLVTIGLGYTLFWAMLGLPQLTNWTGWQLWAARLTLFALVSILFMRAVMFIHELMHLPRKGWSAFRFVWNMLCGIPFLVPSFVYYPHIDHHRRKYYGTDHDGEYLDLSHRPVSHAVLFVLSAWLVPFAVFVRFAILTPVGWFFPQVQQWVEKHASSMVVDLLYTRGDFGPKARRIMRIQEFLCFLRCLWLVARAPLISGQWIDGFLIHAYFLSVTLITINNVRTLGAHRWTGDGRELTFEEQLLDSVNYPHRPWLTELWGPVGTRYHALHHLFPTIPYHNLGIAHRRLVAGLPAGSLYHQTIRVSLFQTIGELLRRSIQSRRQPHFGETASDC